MLALFNAWRMYGEDGRATPRVTRTAAASLIPLLVAAIFLFGLDWGTMWPAFLIVAGLGALMSRGRTD